MASIGPTAFYTGEVWSRHGLSHPELARVEGRLLHLVTEPTMLMSRLLGGPTLEGMLLGRHKVIDALLEEAIEAGTVGQVLEVAAGMSPRGWRFTERHRDLVYVEADLPEMAARKREALERIGRPDTHRVVELDALTDEGPLSLEAVAERELEEGAGLAIITEGLLSYLPREPVLSLWSGFAATIARSGGGVYLSDLHVDSDTAPLVSRIFAGVLSAFVLGPVRLHFADAEEARDELLHAGFDDASVEPVSEHPQGASRPGAEHVRVVRATVG